MKDEASHVIHLLNIIACKDWKIQSRTNLKKDSTPMHNVIRVNRRH